MNRERLIPMRAQGNTLELWVRNIIGGDGYDDTYEQELVWVLTENRNATEVRVYIDSPGGNVNAGNAIIAAMQQHPGTKTAIITGMCGSMATIIALACDRRQMYETAVWMAHYPLNGAYGREKEMQQAIDTLAAMNKVFLAMYTRVTGKPEDEIDALLKEERVLTAQQAVDWGFVDEVLSITPKPDAIQLAAFMPPAMSAQKATQKANPENHYTMKNIAQKLGLRAEASEQVVEDALSQALEDRDKAVSQVAALQKQLNDLQAQMQAAQEAEDSLIVDTAVNERRISANAKPFWLTALKTDRKGAAEQLAALRANTTSITAQLRSDGSEETDEDRKTEWMKLVKAGKLHALKAENPKRYEQLMISVNPTNLK